MTNLVLYFPSNFKDLRRREHFMGEVMKCICALLNSSGGTLTLTTLDNDYMYVDKSLDRIVRMVEQGSLHIISVAMTSSLIKIIKSDFKIVMTINACNHLTVLRWNCFLSLTAQVAEMPPYEPIETIKKMVDGKIEYANLTPIGSHCKRFIFDQMIDFEESSTVQLKCLNETSRFKSFVSLIFLNKFLVYVSAFANCSGGHIYYGITDDRVVRGQTISESDIREISCKLENKINTMVWPHQIGKRPKKGTQWDVSFEPVEDVEGRIIPFSFVIVVFIAQCPGGVFTKEPETYHVVNGDVVKISYPDMLRLLFFPDSEPTVTEHSLETLDHSRMQAVCQKLNILRPLGGDFKALGKLIGMSDVDIEKISQRSNPAASLFSLWEKRESVTITRLRYLLLRLERNDVVEILDKALQTADSGIAKSQKQVEFDRVLWSEVCQKEIDVLLLTSGTIEFIEVTKVLQDPKEADSTGRVGSVVFGTVGRNHVAVLKTSPSTADVMVTCLNAFHELSIKTVVSLGTCTGLKRKEHRLGDVLVSTKLATFNPRPDGQDSSVWSSGKVVLCNRKFAKLFESGRLHGPDINGVTPGVHSGLLISGPHIINDKSQMNFLKRSYDEVLGLETEGEGLYSYCSNFGIPWMICKAIVRWADDDGHESHECRVDDDGREDRLSDQTAAEISASFVQDVLSRNCIRDAMLDSTQVRVEPPDNSSDYFSEYSESIAPDERLFEIPDKNPFRRAFLSEDEQDFSDDCKEYLERLDWVEDFSIAEADEECQTRHLEIVCKFGTVPCITDIMQHFGEDVLPFVTYKAEGAKLDCFINEDGVLKDEFGTALKSIDWVESYKAGVVITCKDEDVPLIGDLTKKIPKDILPYIEFTNINQWKSQEPKFEQNEKVNIEKTAISSDNETDEELDSDSEECTTSASDDEEDVSWFESTVLNSDYEVRIEYREALRSLGWVKACAVAVPNEEHDELHLLIICKKGEVPRMAQLKECFGVKIVSYVEFMAEIKDFKFLMNEVGNDGESSSAPKLCQAMSGDGIYLENEGPNCYGTVGFFVRTEKNFNKLLCATCYHVCYCGEKLPKDKKEAHQILINDSRNEESRTRTASFWRLTRRERKGEQSRKDIEEKNEGIVLDEKEVAEVSEERLNKNATTVNEEDYNNSTADAMPEGLQCKGSGKKERQNDNFSMQRKDGEKIEVEERDEQKQSFDERQEQEAKKTEGETVELENNNESIEKEETIKLGPFSWGKYDNRHDICFVEQGPDVKCECQIPVLKPEEIPRKKKIVGYIKKGAHVVEKTGCRTGTRTGRLLGFNYCELDDNKTSRLEAGLVVEDEDCNQPFALDGDSGSLVKLVTHNDKKIPIAYLKLLGKKTENGGNQSDVHFCLCLVDLLRECRKDKKVGELQLYLTGCVCDGPAFKIMRNENNPSSS